VTAAAWKAVEHSNVPWAFDSPSFRRYNSTSSHSGSPSTFLILCTARQPLTGFLSLLHAKDHVTAEGWSRQITVYL
jgi:hypothetical protein